MKLSSNSSTSASSVKLTAEAGKTHSVTIGGVGRPVVGRIVLPASLAAMPWVSNNAFIRSKLDLPKIPYPENFSTLSVEERKAWYAKWAATDEGKKLAAAYDKYYDEMRHYTVAVAADGSFHTEEVLAGSYVLTLDIRRPSGNHDDVLASGSKDFVVPAIPGGVSDEVLDLGEVVLKE